MPPTFETTRRVEFSETDMAGFVHFTSFFHYMEETEHAFLRSLDLGVVMHDERGTIGFPRLAVSCKYLQPAYFEELLTVRLDVVRNDGKSMTHAFEIARQTDPIALGRFEVACCRFPSESKPFAIPMPDRVLERIPLIQ